MRFGETRARHSQGPTYSYGGIAGQPVHTLASARAVSPQVRRPSRKIEFLDLPTAAVMCGGGLGAYDMVRALGMAGVPSAVYSSVTGEVAFRSRYARRTLRLPEFREWNYQKIFDRIKAFPACEGDRPVLFYAGDSELMFMSRFREQLAQYYRFLLPPPSVLEAVAGKAQFIGLARAADFPAPPARAFSSVEDLESQLDTVPLPCIVKPSYNYDWFWEDDALARRFGEYKHALRRFDSRGELLAFCAGLPARPAGFIVQSYINGRDESVASFHGYFDETSRCLGAFLTREIRTNPPHAGNIAYCETFHDERLMRLSIECLRRIGFQGVVKVDYKWDARAEEYKMLEIEPTSQGWHLLGAYAGINLAAIAYRHQRGEPVSPLAGYKDGVRLLHFSQDLRAFLFGYLKNKEWTWLGYLKSLRGEKHYRLFDPEDPLPFFYAAIGYLWRKWTNAMDSGVRE